jgi:hypothetical protein
LQGGSARSVPARCPGVLLAQLLSAIVAELTRRPLTIAARSACGRGPLASRLREEPPAC